MKKKLILFVVILSTAAVFTLAGVFLSHNTSRVEKLFDETIEALNSEKGLKELFTSNAIDETNNDKDTKRNIDKEIVKLNKFYVGKSVKISDFSCYRESNTGYRMYAYVTTDSGEYFVCILGSGARLVDTYGIEQIIIEDSQEFKHKNLFKKKEFNKYLDHAEEYGITIRVKGDKK